MNRETQARRSRWIRPLVTTAMLGAASLGLAPTAAAHGSFAMSLTTTRGDLQLGLSNPSTMTYGGGMAYTWGSGDKKSAFVGSGGMNLRYYKANTHLYGDVSSFEFSTPVTMGWRVGTVAFGGALEFRRLMRTGDDTAVQQIGNGNILLYGPYARIAFGRPGSTAGRFGLEGRYFWGEGWFEQFDGSTFLETGQFAQEVTMDMAKPSELRLALSFLATPKTILRLEYQDSKFLADPNAVYTDIPVPDGVGQSMKSLGLTIGLVF